jgi:hypothetical protein
MNIIKLNLFTKEGDVSHELHWRLWPWGWICANRRIVYSINNRWCSIRAISES